jgi:hypothetical protein
MKFWIPWSIDAVVATILVGFFIIGIGDRSVSSFNIGLWILILGVALSVVAGSLALRSANHIKTAIAVASAMAIPGFLVGLFFLAILMIPARWN